MIPNFNDLLDAFQSHSIEQIEAPLDAEIDVRAPREWQDLNNLADREVFSLNPDSARSSFTPWF